MKILLRISFAILASFFPALVFAPAASACDYCLISQGISPLETFSGDGLRVNQRYTRLTRVYNGTNRVKLDASPKEEHWTTDVTGFYSIGDSVTILANAPYRKTRLDGHLHVHPDGTGEVHTDMKGAETGLGDVSVIGRYSFFKKHTLDGSATVAGLIGIKLPTGKTDGRTDDGMDYLDSHLQLGSGSTDFLVGVSASRSADRLTLSANVLGSIPTNGKAGAATHRFGNMLNYDLTAKCRVSGNVSGASKPAVFLSLGVNGEARGREKEDGVTLANSGGHTVYLSPGVQAAAGRHWTLELAYQQAIYHNLYGTQIGEDFRTTGGVTYLF
ncbi:MAG: hypothetical protein HZB82_08555 [Deltaproteobacteria bacterium]|nr:hypothetical protein [Deltaproteobacteria bacterium]